MTDETTTPRPDTEARNVSVAERPGGGYAVKVCAGTACVFAGSLAVYDAFVQEVQDGRARRQRRSEHHRLSRPVLDEPRGGAQRRHALRPPQAQGRRQGRRGAPQGRHAGRALPLQGRADRRAHPRLARHRVLQGADAHRAARRRRHQPREHRRVHRRRRLRGRQDGALGEDARVDHRARHRLGHPRPRRRRVPHGRQVEVRQRSPRATRSTSSATPTRATPARSWTAPSSRATRTRSSRA